LANQLHEHAAHNLCSFRAPTQSKISQLSQEFEHARLTKEVVVYYMKQNNAAFTELCKKLFEHEYGLQQIMVTTEKMVRDFTSFLYEFQ